MAPSVSVRIFRAEHESSVKNFPSRHNRSKKGLVSIGRKKDFPIINWKNNLLSNYFDNLQEIFESLLDFF